MAYLTPDAKTKLSSTIRDLRDRLLTDIHNGTESFYRLSVPLSQAGLGEEARIKRQRLEKWLDEQVRSEGKTPKDREIWERYRLQAEKLAAATFLNRLVVIKQLEAMGLSKPLLVTGGWNSPAYREFREFAPDLLRDETEGMGLLLGLLYDELALDLPGLFGRGGITDLFPIPANSLRVTIEALNQLELQDIWLDDTVLGWVYQFWNDPEREDLDKKLNEGGKVEPHEIASKTQMFTERYMVEWLLHNSLGQLWLGICQANHWQAEVISSGTLARLEERRSQWREWRESGQVALDALMPMETELEERWKYFVSLPSSPNPFSQREKGNQTQTNNETLSQKNSTSSSPLLPGEGPGVRFQLSELAGRKRQIPPVLLEKAKELRKNQTPAESLLWECLRDRQLLNAKFRRQHNIGQIIVDFYCHQARLIIELDGGIHLTKKTEDSIRDNWLTEQGLQVLRFDNDAVLNETKKVLNIIADYLESSSSNSLSQREKLERPSSPNPFSQREKGNQTNDESLSKTSSVSSSPLLPGEGPGVRSVTNPSSPNPFSQGEKGNQTNNESLSQTSSVSFSPLLEGEGPGVRSIRDLKILDPACGSGHFLVIAVGLLFALYQEEARHRQEVWTDELIIKSILENNLYGLDIDPRAVQIAAAALWLKAKSFCPKFSLKSLNLVASNLNLAALAKDDPDLVALRRGVYEVTGIPENLTEQIIQSLRGADQWGSLLKVDEAVDRAISEFEANLGIKAAVVQRNIFEEVGSVQRALDFDAKQVKFSLLEKVESFLAKHTGGDDLGLRLRGQQLAAGVRFIRMIRENSYDLVIGNPPYQGSSKMADSKYLEKHYPRGKADLYAAFLERGLQLAKTGGFSALLTMRNWMFISQFSDIRQYLIDNFDLRALGDFDRGAFDEVPNEILAVVLSIFQKHKPSDQSGIAIQPTPFDDNSYDRQRTNRKRAAVLLQVGRYEFHTDRFEVIKDKPLIYWWDEDFLKRYAETPKLGDESDVKQGMATAENTRFLRLPWEINNQDLLICSAKENLEKLPRNKWTPYIKGAAGQVWFEPLSDILKWHPNALEVKLLERNGKQASRPQNEKYYFKNGVSYSTIGASFLARNWRFRSVFDVSGSSVFPFDTTNALCLLNSQQARQILSALNPTVNFQVGDVKRLPLFPIESADEIFAQLEIAFSQHEAARETSVEFQQPGPTAWNYAQQWAQQAVDREPGTPLPPYQPIYEDPTPEQHLSYSIGLALGRFGPSSPNPFSQREKGNQTNNESLSQTSSITSSPLRPGEGPGVRSSLPHGILYLSTYSSQDSLSHPASQIIQDTWQQQNPLIKSSKGEQTLKKWLRENFFSDIHLKMYENRPIYFPLSSAKKNFVALISIHRWQDNTLQILLADYLNPELTTMEGELKDLSEARTQSDKSQRAKAEKRYTEIQKLYDELQAFITLIAQTAEQGPPPANGKDQPRETDARFQMNLDDGVMINSAALWSLLEPQWKQPKKWWSELCNAQGKSDYDWSHLAQRYFPDRVDQKCQKDPSLAVAHGVFWKYHPAKAYEWELRLQDEIGPDFTLDENHSDQYRQNFIQQHPQTVAELHTKEEKRRDRKYNKEKTLPLFAQ